MAYVGLAKPIVAKYANTAGTPTYTEGFSCGKAIEMTISPQYNEGSLYGDDEEAEYDKEFKYADITMNTTTLPLKAHEILFGHTVVEASTGEEAKTPAKITDKADDEANYVGVGFFATEKVNGVRKYIAFWMYKVKFSESEESYTTKGDSIEYKTPSIAGRALSVDEVGWRERSIHDTKAEALEWLNKMAGITAAGA